MWYYLDFLPFHGSVLVTVVSQEICSFYLFNLLAEIAHILSLSLYPCSLTWKAHDTSNFFFGV